MILFRIVYKRQNDDQEWKANIVGNSPEEVQEFLVHQFGELPYFSVIQRLDIHKVMPSIEKSHYLKVKREIGE